MVGFKPMLGVLLWSRITLSTLLPARVLRLGRKAWWCFWSMVFSTGRAIRAWSTTISAIGTIMVVLVGLWMEWDAIVVVTLFYATALFFTNFLNAERPFPVISKGVDYYGPSYGGENDGRGFQYEIFLRNTGTAPLIDPSVEYRLLDDNLTDEFDNDEKWIEHSVTDREECILEPGELITLEIEHAPIEHDGATDYYIWIKVTPRTQYREMTLLHSFEIKGEE